MVDTTFIEKISLIFKFLKDNYMFSLIMLLIGIIIMDLLYGRNKKGTKKLYGIIITLLIIFILLTYYKSFIEIFDVYIAYIFKVAYFPSIIEYTTMILITIIIQMISCIKNYKVMKHINLWVGIIIEILFITNLIALNGLSVDLSTLTSIYEKDILLAIFQLTGIIFILWLLLNIIIFIIKLFLKNKIEIPKLNKDYY